MRVDVLTSGIWQTTTTILSADGVCVVVDPAYFPRELDAIRARVAELGAAAAVVFTHGHWDHVIGHHALPGAPVWLSAALDAAISAGDPRAARYLADAAEFDSKWYVPRPGPHAWPTDRRPLADGDVLAAGPLALTALHLPGHSPDGLGLRIADVLLVGDHLSPCEIPFVDDHAAYRATLVRLGDVLGTVREVIPGHGPRLTAAEARAIAISDLAYLDELAERVARGDLAGARDMALPRAATVVGMRDAHLANVAKLAGPAGA